MKLVRFVLRIAFSFSYFQFFGIVSAFRTNAQVEMWLNEVYLEVLLTEALSKIYKMASVVLRSDG